MSLKHKWQIYVGLLGVIQLAQCATLRLYCADDISLTNFVEVPLIDAKSLMTNNCYNRSRISFFYIFGFTGQVQGSATTTVLKTVISVRTYNVFLLNWEKEASSINNSTNPTTKQISYVVTGLAEAFNVGSQFGKALLDMSEAGLDLEGTYVTGHSLGAQLAAQAGRTVIAAGLIIGWIFGLDPSGPFYGNPPLIPSLRDGDAQAVFCVHTDPGDYGVNKTVCQVDVLVNFEYFTLPDKEDQVQPGCPIGSFPKFSVEDTCSHNLSWMLFSEGVLNPNSTQNLLASKADNVWDWEQDKGDCSDTVAIGIRWDTKKRGVYFIETKPNSPYGLGEDGACPDFNDDYLE